MIARQLSSLLILLKLSPSILAFEIALLSNNFLKTLKIHRLRHLLLELIVIVIIPFRFRVISFQLNMTL